MEGRVNHTSELEAKAQAEPKFISQIGKKTQMKGDKVWVCLPFMALQPQR